MKIKQINKNLHTLLIVFTIFVATFTVASFLPGESVSALKCTGNQKLHSDNLCWDEKDAVYGDKSNPASATCFEGSLVGGKCHVYAGLPTNDNGSPVNQTGVQCPADTEFHASDGKCWEKSYTKVIGRNEQNCKGTITAENGNSADVTGEAHWDNGSCWVVDGYENSQDPTGFSSKPDDPNANLNYCDKTYVSEGKDNQTANRQACIAGQEGKDCTATYAAPNQAAQKAACEAGVKNPSVTPPLNGLPGNKQTSSGDAGTCGDAKTNLITCSGSGAGALADVLKIILFILTILIGIVATGGIVYGAVLYASAQDNAGQVGQAKTIIRDVVIGLLLYGFMVAIINWLVPGGVIG